MPLHLLRVLLISSTFMTGFLHFSSSRLCSNSSRSPFNSLYLDFKSVGSSPDLIAEMMLFIFFVVMPILASMFLCISSRMSLGLPHGFIGLASGGRNWRLVRLLEPNGSPVFPQPLVCHLTGDPSLLHSLANGNFIIVDSLPDEKPSLFLHKKSPFDNRLLCTLFDRLLST